MASSLPAAPSARRQVLPPGTDRVQRFTGRGISNRNYYGLEIDLNCCKQRDLIFSNRNKMRPLSFDNYSPQLALSSRPRFVGHFHPSRSGATPDHRARVYRTATLQGDSPISKQMKDLAASSLPVLPGDTCSLIFCYAGNIAASGGV